MRFAWLLLLATVVNGAEVTQVGRWHLHNSFWTNLHQRLMHDATTAMPAGLDALSAEERETWQATLAAYRSSGEGSMTFRRPMLITQDELTQVADDAVSPNLDGPLAESVRDAAPIYRKHFWRSDSAANHFYLAYTAAMLRDAGEELAAAHETAYGTPLPASIRVDIAAHAGPFGAYSVRLRSGGSVVTISSRDPGYAGLAALEAVMHESSHSIAGPNRDTTVGAAILEASAKAGVAVPSELWHAILFATSSELTRRWLAARGAAEYQPFSLDLFTRVWPHYRDAVETYWFPYLSGQGTLEDAVAKIVAAVGKRK